MSRPVKAFLVALILVSAPASAGPLRFQRLSENRFLVEHYSWSSGDAAAYRGALQRAASICRAAGYEYVDVLNRTNSPNYNNATVEFTVHHESSEGRVNCAAEADQKQFEQAKKKLAKMDAKKK